MTERLTRRFQEADKYAAYLRTTEGRLRLDLAWANFRRFLPAVASGRRVLDVGGGTGLFAIRLAELGFGVEVLDNSEPMLAIAADEANAKGLSDRISFRQGDAACLAALFQPSSFHSVVCHNLLEYMEDPLAVVHGLARVLKKDRGSIVSLLVRNRSGEVLKAAIKGKDCQQAQAVLGADTVLDSLYGMPTRLFDPAGVHRMVEVAGLKVVADYGVRVVSDYMNNQNLADDGYRQLVDLELLLGAQPQFAAIARYTQVICCTSQEAAAGGLE
jgi:2-polyprenyl-3-methyl-5-hydroxy-6-metoxy-1,4-benzoquinol methylase